MANKMATTWIIIIFVFAVTCVMANGGSTPKFKGDPCERTCYRSLVWRYRLTCPSSAPFCCGEIDDQFCCRDIRRRIDFNAFTTCPFKPFSSWWKDQWRVIVGMLVSLVAMLCCVTGCYYCCGGENVCPCNSHNRRSTSRRGQGSETVSNTIDSERSSVPRLFNPTSPYAFEPPAYETLPKDPPKYAEIWQGQENAAFVDETRPENSRATSNGDNSQIANSASESTQPPAYSEHDERVELRSTSQGVTISSQNSVVSSPIRNEAGSACDQGTSSPETQANPSQNSSTSEENSQREDSDNKRSPHKHDSLNKKAVDGESQLVGEVNMQNPNGSRSQSTSSIPNNKNNASGNLAPVHIS